ncbi:hypothetical protein MC378_10305 [Polaribacter sp. MSW13]|uniref:Uncharacterized protein n=1 Tax=Polaribacter marinus TaxID=2916838 RepID=A0A9X2AN52_9FLAO|nr:hypothetical protein [Polaribacter marinus]MCI2229559.1 hypothetical protein [Polaribacter marinus]
MEISKKQIQQIQIILSKRELDREERLQFLSDHFNREITTTKDLTFVEAEDLIYFLNTGKKSNSNWAFFDKSKFVSERKLLFSYLYQAQWVTKKEGYTEVPDLERLSNFLKSPKSPVKKPLKKFEKQDWSKLLQAFRNIVKGTYK